jgi:hypothetical protein
MVNGNSLALVLLRIRQKWLEPAEVFMSKKKSKTGNFEARGPSTEEKDALRMSRSGAAESGYHPPTQEDIEDLRKDHSTASAPGLVNADEEVRRSGEDSLGPIDSLSGELKESTEDEDEALRSA